MNERTFLVLSELRLAVLVVVLKWLCRNRNCARWLCPLQCAYSMTRRIWDSWWVGAKRGAQPPPPRQRRATFQALSKAGDQPVRCDATIVLLLINSSRRRRAAHKCTVSVGTTYTNPQTVSQQFFTVALGVFVRLGADQSERIFAV